jgi:hypothetical protein
MFRYFYSTPSCCSCRWRETMSLNFGHQRAFCSTRRWYMGVEGHCGIILTGEVDELWGNLSQCHFVYHKSHMDCHGSEPYPLRWGQEIGTSSIYWVHQNGFLLPEGQEIWTSSIYWVHQNDFFLPEGQEIGTSSIYWVHQNGFLLPEGQEIGASSIYWVHQNGFLLPDDGDRLQSSKGCVLIKNRRWIISNKFIILTTDHRHKPSEFTYLPGLSRRRCCDIRKQVSELCRVLEPYQRVYRPN